MIRTELIRVKDLISGGSSPLIPKTSRPLEVERKTKGWLGEWFVACKGFKWIKEKLMIECE